MPHECVDCGRVYQDGAQSVLSGCECGGKKFQFRATMPDDDQSGSSADDDIITVGSDDRTTDDETDAQREARTDFVDPSDLPSDASRDDYDWSNKGEETDGEDDEADPFEQEFEEREKKEELEAIRRELTEQFGSVKILEPGQYELDLWEMYDRDEYIIALQDDGRYMIEVPYMDDEED